MLLESCIQKSENIQHTNKEEKVPLMHNLKQNTKFPKQDDK